METLASDAPTLKLPNIVDGFRTSKNCAPVPLQSRVLMDVPGGVIRGHTVDVGKHTLNVVVPTKLVSGLECQVFFNIILTGQTYVVIGAARVVSCTSNSSEGYCANLHFTIADAKVRSALEHLLIESGSEPLQ